MEFIVIKIFLFVCYFLSYLTEQISLGGLIIVLITQPTTNNIIKYKTRIIFSKKLNINLQ
mgnify:CR=1 FL=1